MRPVLVPRSLDELWPMVQGDPQPVVFAGGTDVLVPGLRRLPEAPAPLVCLDRIDELRGVRDRGDHIWIGAVTTHAELAGSPLVAAHLEVLGRAASSVGSPQIRNMGTVGGNVCTASPAGDTLPALRVLDARVELRAGEGRRTLPIGEFLLAPGRTALAAGEILAGLQVPRPDGNPIHHFEKVGLRRAQACSVASLAALIGLADDGVAAWVRLAWGSVGPGIVVCPAVEQRLAGTRLDLDTLAAAAAMVREAVAPIDDVRASASYRREVAANLLLRLSRIVQDRRDRCANERGARE